MGARWEAGRGVAVLFDMTHPKTHKKEFGKRGGGGVQAKRERVVDWLE